jgi:hypothetical protein
VTLGQNYHKAKQAMMGSVWSNYGTTISRRRRKKLGKNPDPVHVFYHDPRVKSPVTKPEAPG